MNVSTTPTFHPHCHPGLGFVTAHNACLLHFVTFLYPWLHFAHFPFSHTHKSFTCSFENGNQTLSRHCSRKPLRAFSSCFEWILLSSVWPLRVCVVWALLTGTASSIFSLFLLYSSVSPTFQGLPRNAVPPPRTPLPLLLGWLPPNFQWPPGLGHPLFSVSAFSLIPWQHFIQVAITVEALLSDATWTQLDYLKKMVEMDNCMHTHTQQMIHNRYFILA